MSKILKKDDLNQRLDLKTRLDLEDQNQNVSLTEEKKIISSQEIQQYAQKNSLLEDAKQEAQLIKNQARQLYSQVQQKIEEAKKEGFSHGREEGLKSVTELLANIQLQQEKLKQNLEKEILNLVYEITQKVIGDVLTFSEDALVGLIQQGLHQVLGKEIMILVNPQDYEKIKKNEQRLMLSLQGLQKLVLKPVETVKAGGCVIESEVGTIDAQLETQLAALKKILTPTVHSS